MTVIRSLFSDRLEFLLPQADSVLVECVHAILGLIASESPHTAVRESGLQVFVCLDTVSSGRLGLLGALESYCEFIRSDLNARPSLSGHAVRLPPPLIVTYRPAEFLDNSFAFPPEFILSARELTVESLIRRTEDLAQLWARWNEEGGGVKVKKLLCREFFTLDALRECIIPGLRLDLGFDKWHHDHSAELASSLEWLRNVWEGRLSREEEYLIRDWTAREGGISRAEERFGDMQNVQLYQLLFPGSLRSLTSAAQHINRYILAVLESRDSVDRLRWLQQLRSECTLLIASVPKRSGLLVADLPAVRRNILLIDDQCHEVVKIVEEQIIFSEPHSGSIGEFFCIYPAPRSEPSKFIEIKEGLVSLLRRSGEDFCGIKRPEVFDAIFLDLSLKESPNEELGGFELLRLLRDRLPDLPILVFSSFEQYRYIMDAVRFGASWYCKKTEPLTLLRSLYEVTRIDNWEKRAKRTAREIIIDDSIDLPINAVTFICEEIAKDLPSGSACVRRLTGGIGGAVTVRLQVGTSGPESAAKVIPLVVKIDKPYRMLSEYQRFVTFIRPYAENRTGRIDRQFVRAGRELAGIAYSFSGIYQGLGGRARDVETVTLERLLSNRLTSTDSDIRTIEPISTIEPLLDELFGETLAPLHAVSQPLDRSEWWNPLVGEAPSLRGSVELRLPSLIVRLEALLEPDASRDESAVRRIGRRIVLESFFIEDVEPDSITVVGVSGRRIWRAKLEGSYARTLARNRSIRPFSHVTAVGQVQRRRAKSLSALSDETIHKCLQRMGLAAREESRSRQDAIGCSSPFNPRHVRRLLSVLDLVSENVGIVHGDLNLGNILVEITGVRSGNFRPIFQQPWLIDFARTRRDSIAHDFAEMESSIVSTMVKEDLFSGVPTDERPDNLRDFLATFDRTALDFPSNARQNPRLQFIFEFVALVRRKAAQAGISRIEYEVLLYFYYIIVAKISDKADWWTKLSCFIAGHFALKAIREDVLRVSASALWRIEIDGKLLLGLNRNRFARGVSVLTPIGGSVSVVDGRDLANRYNIRWESMTPGGNSDLRFDISMYDLPRFDAWYRGPNAFVSSIKEESASRELIEELVEEFRVVNAGDLVDVKPRIRNSSVSYESTTREGVEGRLTRRYTDIYSPDFPDAASADHFRQAIRKGSMLGTGIMLVSPEEITLGRTRDGISIGSTARSLL